MKIGMIGLGKLGLPTAQLFAEKNHYVSGYDINKIKEPGNIHLANSIEQLVMDSDIVFIAVPTPHSEGYDGSSPTSHLETKDFSYDALNSVVSKVDSCITSDKLLVIISTVLPGTIRNNISKKAKNSTLIYNPYLIAMGSVKSDLLDPEMIMIGSEDAKNDLVPTLLEFYETISPNARVVTGTWEEVECIKIFYNTFISSKLAFVNMIQDVGHRIKNVNVDVVTTALSNSSKRLTSPAYMKAGMGDGGACHPRDNIALQHLANQLDLGYNLFSSISKAREQQAKNMAIEILKHGSRVQFSSDTFKPTVNLTDGSYSLLVQHYIRELNGIIVYSDPEVYVLVHQGDEPPKNVLVFDPWRTYKGHNRCIFYGFNQ